MVRRLAIILLAALYLLTFVGGASAAKPHDVSSGMVIEDALKVAKRCVIAAARFRDPRDEKFKEIRPQDSLQFAGITDSIRLNTLRRYVVRNVEIGAQSVYGFKEGHVVSQPYLIPNSALADIAMDLTVERLAREIIKNSGLPYLTYKRSSQVVANCRREATGKQDEINTNQRISQDIPDLLLQSKLQQCLQSGRMNVLPGTGITDGEGDFYPYDVSDDLRGKIGLTVTNEKYSDLIDIITKNAEVALPATVTAPALFANAAFKWARFRCNKRSFAFSSLCGLGTLDKNTTISMLFQRGVPATKDTFNTALNTLAAKTLYRRDQYSFPTKLPNLSSIDPDKQIWLLIKEIQEELEKSK